MILYLYNLYYTITYTVPKNWLYYMTFLSLPVNDFYKFYARRVHVKTLRVY